MQNTIRKFCVLLAAATVAAGCSSEDSEDTAAREVSNLRMLVSFYIFANNQLGRPPASEQEFKDFIAANGSAAMERLQLTGPDELLVSERDGQPFVIVYGKRPAGMSPDVVAYEKNGVDGKREVGFKLGMVNEVDEARFKELVP
jgi:hypothetical protein